LTVRAGNNQQSTMQKVVQAIEALPTDRHFIAASSISHSGSLSFLLRSFLTEDTSNSNLSSAIPRISRWNLVNIENDIATNWHERGRSFKGMEPWSLLVAPADHDESSCLCDFGVQNCWDFKRDGGMVDDLERLDMARSLWDATPSELVSWRMGRGGWWRRRIRG
jgi:hypothetical protein